MRVYGGPWPRLRLEVLNRDGWRCQVRGERCQGVASVVDYIVPVRAGLGGTSRICERPAAAATRRRRMRGLCPGRGLLGSGDRWAPVSVRLGRPCNTFDPAVAGVRPGRRMRSECGPGWMGREGVSPVGCCLQARCSAVSRVGLPPGPESWTERLGSAGILRDMGSGRGFGGLVVSGALRRASLGWCLARFSGPVRGARCQRRNL